MKLSKSYVSTDVEYSGSPDEGVGEGDLLSLGSCIVGDINNNFYTQIQPVTEFYNEAAMRVISTGFIGLNDSTHSSNPAEILEELKKKGIAPETAMSNYAAWLNTLAEDITEMACPIKFDGGLTNSYFRKYYQGENPLGYSGTDGNSMLQGFLRDIDISFKKFLLRDGELPHNALKDAQIQAIEMEFLLKLMQLEDQEPGIVVQSFKKHGVPGIHAEFKAESTWVKDTISTIRNNHVGAILDYESILTK